MSILDSALGQASPQKTLLGQHLRLKAIVTGVAGKKPRETKDQKIKPKRKLGKCQRGTILQTSGLHIRDCQD